MYTCQISFQSLGRSRFILYQSEDATQQTFQLPLYQYHPFSCEGIHCLKLVACQENGGGDEQWYPPTPWYEEQKLMLESWLYNVGVGYPLVSCQRPNDERMEQSQQFHNCIDRTITYHDNVFF